MVTAEEPARRTFSRCDRCGVYRALLPAVRLGAVRWLCRFCRASLRRVDRPVEVIRDQ